MIDPQPITLAILTSIITGGFVLVLVEIGNRKNRENFFVSKRGITDRDSIKQIKIELVKALKEPMKELYGISTQQTLAEKEKKCWLSWLPIDKEGK